MWVLTLPLSCPAPPVNHFEMQNPSLLNAKFILPKHLFEEWKSHRGEDCRSPRRWPRPQRSFLMQNSSFFNTKPIILNAKCVSYFMQDSPGCRPPRGVPVFIIKSAVFR